MPATPKPDATPAPKVAPPKVAAPPAGSPLHPAGASGDPSVHQLLAERQTAVLNEDAAAVARVDEALAALGFTAS